MKTLFKILGLTLALLVLLIGGLGGWYVYTKQPERSGSANIHGLSASVSVRYDERGVPHIRADNEADMYKALGYVHAQDRLFQMEIVRRLAKGELAEILGPKLLETDKLFRTLGIRAHAQDYVARMDMNAPSAKALLAYLDGINQYQATHKAPIEFDVLRIPKRPFTPEDSIAVTGYLAYSFAAAFTTEPVMTFIRDKLGPKYLTAFDIDWHPEGVITPLTAETIGKPEGITPRWFKVSHVGDEIDWLTPGEWVLVDYGRWTDSFEVDGVKYWKIDPDGCALTSPEKPADSLNVAFDSIFAPKLTL